MIKNKELYKTFEEREEAFGKFCTRCENCVLDKQVWWRKYSGGKWQCAFAWLELDEAEEKQDEKL